MKHEENKSSNLNNEKQDRDMDQDQRRKPLDVYAQGQDRQGAQGQNERSDRTSNQYQDQKQTNHRANQNDSTVDGGNVKGQASGQGVDRNQGISGVDRNDRSSTDRNDRSAIDRSQANNRPETDQKKPSSGFGTTSGAKEEDKPQRGMPSQR